MVDQLDYITSDYRWLQPSEDMPKDGSPVLLATKCGKVIKSRWLPEDKQERRPVGRWEFLAAGEEPICWKSWPKHPLKVK